MNHWGKYNYGGWAGCDLRYDILGSTDVAPSGYGAAVGSGRTGYNPSDTCATNPVPNTLMAALPSDLRAAMKPMTKYTDNTGGSMNSANVTASIDYLPLLAPFEIVGARKYDNQYEQNRQKQYAYFVFGNSSKKYRSSNVNEEAIWWTRSVKGGSTADFCRVYTSGGVVYNTADISYGLAPIFKI